MAQLPDFHRWIPLMRLCVSELPHYGAISAVYGMRSTTTGEILYIGSTNDLRRRILGNYLGGVGGQTTQRLHELLFSEGKIGDVDLAWLEADAYVTKEKELKEKYRGKHGHLPKWNRA